MTGRTRTPDHNTDQWRETPVAEVPIVDAEGNRVATIKIPYDAEHKPSDEELKQRADRLYQAVDHVHSWIGREEVEDYAKRLSSGEYGKWIVSVIAETLEAAKLAVTMSPDDEKTPEDIEEDHEVSHELNKILQEKRSDIVRAALGEHNGLWSDMAHDVLMHAWAYAVEEMLEDYPSPESISEDDFDQELRRRFSEGSYLAQATMALTPQWGQILQDFVANLITGNYPSSDETSFADRLEERTRERVRKRRPQGPVMRPIFNEDGYGFMSSDAVSNGLRRSLTDIARWYAIESTGRPESVHNVSPTRRDPQERGRVFYGMNEGTYPTPEDAFDVVRRLGIAHYDVFSYIMATWLANRQSPGPFDGVYVSADRFYDERGLARMASGVHRPEYIEAFDKQIADLQGMTVAGQVPHHKGKKHPAIYIDTDLVNITHRVRQKRIDGSSRTIGYYVRPGDWAAEMQDMAPQVALTMRAVFQLDNKRKRLTKQIALYLLEQFKISGSSKNAARVLRVETILEGACIHIGETERKNPGRFRRMIEDAIDDLETMDPAILSKSQYLDTIPTKGRGMIDQWRQARLRLTPAPAIREQYAGIADTREARIERHKPKLLKG